MLFPHFSKSAITIASVVFLAACSSGSDDSETPAPDAQPIPNDEPASPVDTGPANNPGTAALFGPAQFITSECGSLTASVVTATNSVEAPSEFSVGELVSGQVVPNSETDNFHVWQIALEPGNYHFVADASAVGEEFSTNSINVVSLGITTGDDSTIVSDAVNGFDIRLHEYLEIQTSQILTLKIDAGISVIQDYTVGIFRNGTAVPSPSFFNCLPINTISLDSTQSALLPLSITRADSSWYQIELERGTYTLDASTSSAEFDTLAYQIDSFAEFGQFGTERNIVRDSLNGTSLSTSDSFTQDGDGPIWLRLKNSTSANTVEFTISRP